MPRDIIVSGHRDTHFSFLRNLKFGDRIVIDSAQGSRTFSVSEIDIVDSRVQELVIEPDINRLSLVTCYPFDALTPGGPLRYVVTAEPAKPPR